MQLSFDQVKQACAQAAHEMNRVYCQAIGDFSQVPWAEAPEWQLQSARNGVDGVFAGAGPEKSHEGWLEEKRATGWKYGPVKDAEKKEHPCFVPYNELTPEHKQKDFLFVSTVHHMAAALGHPVPQAVMMQNHLKVETRPA